MTYNTIRKIFGDYDICREDDVNKILLLSIVQMSKLCIDLCQEVYKKDNVRIINLSEDNRSSILENSEIFEMDKNNKHSIVSYHSSKSNLLRYPSIISLSPTGSMERITDGKLSRVNTNTNHKLKIKQSKGQFFINNYKVIRKVGKGSYGNIYLAINENNMEYCAIKKINIKRNALNKNVYNEIEIMKLLHHKNIIPLYEIIDNQEINTVYLIMKYIENKYVISHMYNCLPETRVRNYILQLIDCLQYIHSCHIIHHDIKPENLLIDKDDVLYLIDFGSSEQLDKNMITTRRIGTLTFFSPELFEEQDDLDGCAIDIWALGITIYIMLYGKLPFIGSSYCEIKNSILHKDIMFPDIATKLQQDFLAQILCKNPAKRVTLSQMKQHPFLNKNKFQQRISIKNTKRISVPNENTHSPLKQRQFPFAELFQNICK